MFCSPHPIITATHRASAGYRPSAGFANSDISPVRDYCRNPRCRSKLKEPVSNPHKAFCTKGCYGSFYLRRCAVCENNKPDGSNARRILCRRPKCESRYRQNRDLYSHPGEDSVRTANGSRNPIKSATKSRLDDDRPWRVVAAGKPLSANQYYCAIVGTADAVAAADRTVVHWRGLSSAPTITISATIVATWAPATASVFNPEDLSIPAFLRRASAASGAP
jgi:hypothetical protein